MSSTAVTASFPKSPKKSIHPAFKKYTVFYSFTELVSSLVDKLSNDNIVSKLLISLFQFIISYCPTYTLIPIAYICDKRISAYILYQPG